MIPCPSTRMPRFVDVTHTTEERRWGDDEPTEVEHVLTEVRRPDLVDPVSMAKLDSKYVTFVEGNPDA